MSTKKVGPDGWLETADSAGCFQSVETADPDGWQGTADCAGCFLPAEIADLGGYFEKGFNSLNSVLGQQKQN